MGKTFKDRRDKSRPQPKFGRKHVPFVPVAEPDPDEMREWEQDYDEARERGEHFSLSRV